jgi:hypothetical protein
LTNAEKRTVAKFAGRCIMRVRKEAWTKFPDYEKAADDVCNELAALAEWMQTLPVLEPQKRAKKRKEPR